jgi:hypothetical protein
MANVREPLVLFLIGMRINTAWPERLPLRQ